MRILKVANHLTEKELKQKLKKEKNFEQFRRWQCIYLIKSNPGIKSEAVASILGCTKYLIYYIVETYNSTGVKGIKIKGRGGRRTAYLTLEEEKKLLTKIEKDAIKGLILTKEDIREIIEKKLGHEVSDDYIWDLFHRHGWKKKVPRPEHPKKNIKEQEEFKKKSRKIWMPPENNL